MSERKGRYQGDRGPDKVPRKNSPRNGRRATGTVPRDDKPGRLRRARAMELLVAGQPVHKVAAEVGVAPQTIYKWMERPDFADELARRQEALVAAARRRLHGAAFDAADTLVEMAIGNLVVEDEEVEGRPRRAARVDPGRVRAAEAVLNRVGLPAGQSVTLDGGVAVTLPDLRGHTPEQLRAMVGDDSGKPR